MEIHKAAAEFHADIELSRGVRFRARAFLKEYQRCDAGVERDHFLFNSAVFEAVSHHVPQHCSRTVAVDYVDLPDISVCIRNKPFQKAFGFLPGHIVDIDFDFLMAQISDHADTSLFITEPRHHI